MPWADFWMVYAQVVICAVTGLLVCFGVIKFVVWMDS